MRSSQQEEVVYEFTPDPAPAPARQVTAPYSHSFGAKHSSDADGLDTKELAVAEVFETFRQAEAERAKEPRISERLVYERRAGTGAEQSRSFEAPEERLVRLQAEVAELLEMADAASNKSDEAVQLLGADPAAVASELKILEQRLGGVARDGPASWREGSVNVGSHGGQHALSQALLNQLDRYSLVSQASGRVSSGTSGAGQVLYELNYTPSVAALADTTRVAALESTVAELEKRSGVMGERAHHFPDLQTAVAQLQKRLSLLDTGRLDMVSRRVQAVMAEVDAVLSKKAELQEAKDADADVDRKINELYEFCHCWSSTAASLPAMVDRLQSLQALHHQSASFATRLEALESQQDELTRLLETTSVAVQELGVSLKDNVTIMRDNMKTLESKILAVVKS